MKARPTSPFVFSTRSKIAPFSKASHDIRFSADTYRETNIRLYIIPIAITCAFLIFFARLFHISILKGTYYQHLAEDNRIKEVYLEGKRGTIYDRKGRVLVESLPNPDKPETFIRTYNNGPAYAHVLGYRQTASDYQLKHDACMGLAQKNDKIGIKGTEEIFECHLRAQKGKRLIETDAHGKEVRIISQVEPKPGLPIKLSIDSELQQKALEVIQANAIHTSVTTDLPHDKISIVALNPNTGEVVMLLSYPTFDPQDFENGASAVTQYLQSKDKPLFDRATLGAYPPGSVFKPILAVGALEDKKITEDEIVIDNGFLEAGPIKFNNWFYRQYGKTDGPVDLRKGLQRSNDIYFYTLGERLAPEGIKKWAHLFGLGQKTGIQLDEATGSIPTPFWKSETLHERWYLGDTYNLSIGQGYLLTTPLQIAHATAIIANGGSSCTPTILRSDASENSDIIGDKNPDCTPLHIQQSTIKAVQEGMNHACQPGGTGWPFFDFRIAGDSTSEATDSASQRIQVGCKTGTAESQSADSLPHAWFTVFAPYEKPEIVLTVMVENAGEGSNVAAPIAKEILKAYFERRE